MSSAEKRTVSLPPEHAAFADRMVASGDYASFSEVVRAGLRALRERDQAVERWLRDEVVPGIVEYEADPSTGVPADDILHRLHARRATAKEG